VRLNGNLYDEEAEIKEPKDELLTTSGNVQIVVRKRQ
jgi:hypothetical protein